MRQAIGADVRDAGLVRERNLGRHTPRATLAVATKPMSKGPAFLQFKRQLTRQTDIDQRAGSSASLLIGL